MPFAKRNQRYKMPPEAPIIIKKVRKRHGSHHGGAWKIALADFMTAMMAFFLVMWILGLDQETRSAIAGYFQDPLNFMRKAEGRKLESFLKPASTEPGAGSASKTDGGVYERRQEVVELEAIQKAVEKLTGSEPDLAELQRDIEMRMTDEGLVIEFIDSAGSVFFETGSAVVKPGAAKLFRKLGALLASKGRHVIIDGHTDSRPYPSNSQYDNWSLSQDRANAMLRVLQQGGVRNQSVLAVRGFADRRLRIQEDPYHFSNRRVTVLLPFKWKEKEVVGSSGEIRRATDSKIMPDFTVVTGE